MRKLLRFNIHNLFHSAVFYVFLAILVGWPLLYGLIEELSRVFVAAHYNRPLELMSYHELQWYFSIFQLLP